MLMPTRITAIVAFLLLSAGCDWFRPDPVRGCTESRALNYDSDADEDDGSCSFSKVIFHKTLLGPPIEITVDGTVVGIITATGVPGNCSAPGNALYELADGDAHDWNGVSADGLSIFSGIVQASRTKACVMVRVI